jgi:ATP-dependent helicase/nuclease subunit B
VLQFILGRSGTDKSAYILQEIANKLQESPIGPPILYIVPDQMTFAQEYALLKKDGIKGSIRAQVFSFSRLAWRIFQETGGGTRKFISSTGVQMMLRKITEENKKNLKVFQKAIEKQGFMEQLEGMITEFKRYRITPTDLMETLDQLKEFPHEHHGENILTAKLEDLATIYDQLTFALREKYIDSEDQLQLLAEKITESQYLNNAEIYVDGFYRFTPQELYVLEALMKKVKSIKVSLPMDAIPAGAVDELDLFHQPKQTFIQLVELAEKGNISVNDPIWLTQDKEGNFFSHLEKNFDRHPIHAYEKEAPIKIVQAVHPRAEIEGVAQEILHLVRDQNYRFRDIAILMRESEVYHDLIKTVFQDYQIPVFIDDKRTMLNHPLIELVRSILDVVEGNFRYDSVFRVLKTDLIPSTDSAYPLTQEAIDELENYVLEYGIRSRTRWLKENRWSYQRFRGFDEMRKTNEELEKEEKINRLRNQVVQALGNIDEALQGHKTVKERCTALFTWLEKLGVPKTLEKWRDEYDERGEIERAREQEQVWDAVIQLLDEMVEIIGEEEMSLSLFRTTLESGFETLQFSHVPPSMDHVIVGNVDRSRISGITCAFLLGVNEGIWPLKPKAEGMISEGERSLLHLHGITLADGASRQLLDDRFYIYLAFTSAKNYLWVSYPLSNEEGKTKTPSFYINRLKEMFPQVKEYLLLEDEDEQNPLRFVSVPQKTRAVLTAQLAKYLRGYPMQEVFWDVYHWYIEHNDKDSSTRRVLLSLFYENKPKNLSKTTVDQIYQGVLKSSISRLETFYSCGYKHFAQYTLGLKERNIYRLDSPNIGQLFHEALKQITEWIIEDGVSFQELTSDDAQKYAKRAVEKLAPILMHQILFSTNRYKYIFRKLEEVIIRATNVLIEQSKQSNFQPKVVEFGFGLGQGEKLPALNLPLKNGYEMQLRGRIDRIDTAEIDKQLYLRIIDYKSSKRDLDLIEVYYGLSLQMLTYLDVVLTNAEKWLGKEAHPAGVLYFHVHNPMISDPKSFHEQEIEQEIFKQFKMKGRLLEDPDVVTQMDVNLTEGTSSHIIPVELTKSGAFSKRGTKTLQKEMFQSLTSYVRSLLVGAGSSIIDGVVDLNPFQYDQKSACQFCSFRSLCQFDPTLEENKFHKLKKLKEQEILEEILESGGGVE